jgi:hypothetical protein
MLVYRGNSERSVEVCTELHKNFWTKVQNYKNVHSVHFG